ncbi:MAG TPA: protein kinase [Xanthomonadaceae bacterium]|nr:protein kinase [Xanthomonadaceae bacterium]
MREKFGHYQVVAELGRGGMGAVYKAFEPDLHRHVAIKVMAESLSHDPTVVERFLREARSMASLNDPHIIQVYTIGKEGGQPFFAMEFVEGESLSAMLKREGRLAPDQALSIVHQTAMGLATAHDRGVIHRDIKPGNLMISNRGSVKIADFGIALSAQDISKKLTSTGEFVGTPGYLSPEVCLGKPVDQRSDIFSLGIVLFEMLTGRTPFTDESPLGLMLEVVRAEIPDVRELCDAVDDQIAAILGRMIAKEPEDRYQDCHQLASDLAAHPLLAAKTGNYTVRTQRQSAPAAATVVGQPTPPSLRAAQPEAASVARPAPIPAPSEDTPTGISAARARPVERKRSSPVVPMAIAAVILVVLAGGAFAFRDYLPIQLPGTLTAAVEPSSGLKKVEPAAMAVDADTADDRQPEESGRTLQVADDDRAVASNGGALALFGGIDDQTANAGATDDEAQYGYDEPAPLDEPQDQDLAKAVESAPQVARVEPPVAAPVRVEPAPPPRPAIPRVIVLGVGDPILTQPAEQRVAELLADQGFDLVEVDLIPGLSGIRGDANVDLAALMRRIHRDAELLVLVRAEPLGSQVLTYYGQASTLYSANLQLRAYSVVENRALGAGWRQKVDFTTLNAEQQAVDAIRPNLSNLVNTLAPYRPARRG